MEVVRQSVFVMCGVFVVLHLVHHRVLKVILTPFSIHSR